MKKVKGCIKHWNRKKVKVLTGDDTLKARLESQEYAKNHVSEYDALLQSHNFGHDIREGLEVKKLAKIPDPNDSWVHVELYRWQHGCLPGDSSFGDDGMKKIDIPTALEKMAEAFDGPQDEWPAPFNVKAVLRYVAKYWNKN